MQAVERFSHTPKFAGIASDIVSIPLGGGHKMLVLSGVAAEIPDGRWLHADAAPANGIEDQVRYVWKRIDELLNFHGARIADIVKVVMYTTDSRYLVDPVGTSLVEVFRGGPVPACTGVVVAALAWPHMMVEIDVTAVTGMQHGS